MSNASRTINTFIMRDCDFVTSGDAQYIIQFGSSSTAEYSNIVFENNIFYSTEETGAAAFYLIGNGGSTPVGTLELKQNTFANVYPINRKSEPTHYNNLKSVANYVCTDNLFYLPKYDTDYGSKTSAILTVTPTANVVNNNLLYKTANNDRIRTFYTVGPYTSRTSTESNAVSSVDLANGIIIPATTAGATR